VQCKLSGYPVGEVKKIICPGENKNNRGFEYVIEFADKQEEIVMDKNLWPINENSLESQSDESESDDSSEDPDEEDHLIRGTVEEDAQKEKKAEKKSSVLSTAIPNPVPIAVAEAVPNIAAGRKPKIRLLLMFTILILLMMLCGRTRRLWTAMWRECQ